MRAKVLAVQPYELHGTRYYRVIYQPEGREQALEARLSHDMVYPDPKAGDVIEVHAILGVVDGIAKVEA